MANSTNSFNFKTKKLPRGKMALIVIVNSILVMLLAITLFSYFAENKRISDEQNVSNIESVAVAKSQLAERVLFSSGELLKGIQNFCNKKSVEETMSFLSSIIGDENKEFQLLTCSEKSTDRIVYKGYSTVKDATENYSSVTYTSSSYLKFITSMDSFNVESGSVGFTTAFTNPIGAINSYSMFCPLTLVEEERSVQYFLLNPQTSASLTEKMKIDCQYDNLATAIIDFDGNYLVYEPGYRSLNFYDYIDKFNNISLEQRNAICKEVQNDENGVGVLTYLNSKAQLCTYVYSKCDTGNDWFVVVSVPMEDYVSDVSNSSQPFILMVILVALLLFDIWQLMEANKKLRVSVENEKNANEAKTDFLSRMSHDIRTPLNGIIGLTALALDENNPPKTKDYLENINVSGKFLTGLVNDILDMSRVESGKIQLHVEPCYNEEFINYINAVIMPLSREKKINLTINKVGSTTGALLDRLRFNQIIFNLLSNAVKYTNSGGEISFNWNKQDLPKGKTIIEFSVKDNGIGMSEEFQKHMFEPFTQENVPQTSVTGAGLGLSIVKKLVELMDGKIEVESKLGVGSTFKVAIMTDIYVNGKLEEIKDASLSLQNKKVLVCEDNRINIMVVQRLLEKWGVQVVVCENGQLGVDAFCASSVGEFDAVLMDMKMPVMDGIVATKKIRSQKRKDAPFIPILAMTANAYDSDVKNCLDAGMNLHISKPVNPEELKIQLAEQIYLRKDKLQEN